MSPWGTFTVQLAQFSRTRGLSHLKVYDMRSHAITKLLSDPQVSDQMYTEIAGHVGEAMKRRYSKQRMEKKKIAMDAMCADLPTNVVALVPRGEMRPGRQKLFSVPLLELPAPQLLLPAPGPTTQRPQSVPLSRGFYSTSWTW